MIMFLPVRAMWSGAVGIFLCSYHHLLVGLLKLKLLFKSSPQFLAPVASALQYTDLSYDFPFPLEFGVVFGSMNWFSEESNKSY